MHNLFKIILILFLFFHCSSKNKITPKKAIEEYFKHQGEKYKEKKVFSLRYNPTYCDCPEFEIRLGELWYRVFLEPSIPEGIFNKFIEKAKKDIEEENFKNYKVKGKLSTSPKPCKSGAFCFIFKLEEIKE